MTRFIAPVLSQFYPPALSLDFLGSATTDIAGVTFTRSSAATYFNSSGVLSTAGSNAPRFDYDPVTLAAKGLLIEESRTNLVSYSEDIDNAFWNKFGTTVSANATAAPNGTTTADKIIEDTSNGGHQFAKGMGTIVGTYTISAYVKAAGRYKGYLQFYSTGGNANIFFNLQAGTIVSGSGTMTAVGNGWYRVTATATFTSAVATIYCVIQRDDSATSYTGDGTSGLHVWGLQLEAGAFATSYIPTTSGSAARSADVATMPTAGWYNQSEGTIFAQAISNAQSATNQAVLQVDAADAGRTLIYRPISADTMYVQTDSNAGATQVAMSSGNITSGSSFKVAYAYAVNNFAASLNGANAVVDVSGEVPTGISTLRIGDIKTANRTLNGYIQRIVYWPKALSSAQLQALST